MTRLMKAAFIAAITHGFFAGTVYAQALKDQLSAPKTKLEAFTGESGVVVIKGYTEAGTIKHLGSVAVSAMTFRNANTNEETKGLSISISEPTNYSASTGAFIDYDEINGLLSGIDYISKTDTSVTKLAMYEATYSTKGNFKITVFNNSAGLNQVNIKNTAYGSGAFFKIEDLTKLRSNIAAAKEILDNPDSIAVKGNKAVAEPASKTSSAAAQPVLPQLQPPAAPGQPAKHAPGAKPKLPSSAAGGSPLRLQ